MPSSEELLSKLLGTMQAPIAQFVRTLNEVPTKFARGLAAVRDPESGNLIRLRVRNSLNDKATPNPGITQFWSSKQMALSKAEILDAIAGMSVLELSELIKEMEEKFGVSAARRRGRGCPGRWWRWRRCC